MERKEETEPYLCHYYSKLVELESDVGLNCKWRIRYRFFCRVSFPARFCVDLKSFVVYYRT